MNSATSALVAIALLLAGCGDASTSNAASTSASTAATPASTTSAAPAAAAPIKGTKAYFDAAYETIFRKGSIDEPMPKKIEAFLAKMDAPKKTEGGKRVWYARDATDCYEISLDDSGMMSASTLYENQEAQKKIIDAECPKP